MAVLKLIAAIAIVSCVTAFLPQSVRRLEHSPVICHGRRGVQKSTAPEPINKQSVVLKIRRAKKETFAADVYSGEVEAFLQKCKPTMYKKLKSKVAYRAKELGVEINPKFASKPYTGPPLWLKYEAAMGLQAAIKKRDLAALEAAIETAETMEGIEFVKEDKESELMNEAKALVDTVKAEIEAAEAAAESEEAVEEAPEASEE